MPVQTINRSEGSIFGIQDEDGRGGRKLIMVDVGAQLGGSLFRSLIPYCLGEEVGGFEGSSGET